MKISKKKIIHIFILLVLTGLIAFIIFQVSNKQDTKNKFIIMSTTDMHGKAWDESSEYQEAEPSNMLAEFTAVKQVRDNFGDKTILFDNGDLYQGTSISTIDMEYKKTDIETSTNPMAKCIKEIGYDGYTLGNHEFNYPPKDMYKCYKYLEDSTELVCANMYYPGSGERVYKPYMTKTINVDGQDVKIGIIGLTNTDIPRWDNAVNYQNCIFHSPENPNADIVYEIKKAQAEMQANNDICDFTIVSYHGGFYVEGVSSDNDLDSFINKLESQLNDPLVLYKNTESQGYRAVRQTSGIDMFILGHDHKDTYSNTQYKNADGKDVLVVNGAKTSLTESIFELTKDENGNAKINLCDSQNKKLADYESDGNLKAKIKPYADSLNKLYDTDICPFKGDWNFDYSANEYYTIQNDYADLIGRAQIWFAKRDLNNYFKSNNELNSTYKKMFGDKLDLKFDINEPVDVDLSITSLSPPKNFNTNGTAKYRDVAKLYSYDNTIEYIPTKGSVIKELIEYNASDRYAVKTTDNGEKKLDIINDKFTCPVFWGLNFTVDMNKPEGQRVNIEGFTNGKKFDPNKTYMIVTTNYLRGNMSNPVLKKLAYDDVSLDTKLIPNNNLVRFGIVEYLTYIENNYGAIYPTSEIDKNGETASRWEIKF